MRLTRLEFMENATAWLDHMTYHQNPDYCHYCCDVMFMEWEDLLDQWIAGDNKAFKFIQEMELCD